MSLYRFFETNINENPDLLILSRENSVKANDIYNYFLSQQTNNLFHTFTNILVNDAISVAAKNPIQFELLRLKTRILAQRIETSYKNANETSQ